MVDFCRPGHIYCSILHVYLLYFVGFHPIAIIKFGQLTFDVDENTELARPSILLQSDSLQDRSISLTVTVYTTDGSATGNSDVYCNIL